MKFAKGTIPWNKGFTKKNNEIIKRIGGTNKEKLKCLVIWESELKDLNNLFIKIKKFIADGGQA